MINIKKLIAKFLAWAVKPMVIDTVQSSATVGANNGVSVEINLSKDGFVPLAIVGVRISGSSSGYAEPRQWSLSGNTASAYIWNSSNASRTWTVTYDILWLKLGGAYSVGDTVVEVGSSGGWTYRKWGSGVAECWCVYESAISGATTWGSVYYTTVKTVSFPTNLFAARPSCSVTSIGNSVQGWGTSNNCSKDSVDVFLVRPTTVSSGAVPSLSIFAVGKWK